MLPTHVNPTDRAALSFRDEDYLRFSRLVKERFGLAFPEKRRTELEIGVRRAFAASTCADLNSYYAVLNDPANSSLELERLVNNLTIGETHFFRDAGQFDALANHVLPEIIERRRSTRTLRIWSAGCASGEEPYSIAMLLRDLIPDLSSWTVTIFATDINTQHLERAKRSVYGEWAFRETRAKEYRARYFAVHNNRYQLYPEICRMVTFGLFNLAEDSYPSYETNTMFMDLILCRNVTIYFPEEVTRGVINRFYNALSEGGWLAVGHSEYSLNTYQRFHTHNFPDAILYQRLSDPSQFRELSAYSAFTASVAASQAPARGTLATQPKADPLSVRVKRGGKTGALIPPIMPVKSVTEPQMMNEFEQAQSLLTFGHVDQACKLLLRWLDKHPTHTPACALLGTAYAGLGDWPQAERWCERAIQLDPLNLEGYYILALVFQHQGKTAQAIEMMKKVIYIERTDILGHFNLAYLFYSCGQISLALKFLENTHRILEKLPPDELVPRSGEISVGRLMQTVVRQQQIWANAPTE